MQIPGQSQAHCGDGSHKLVPGKLAASAAPRLQQSHSWELTQDPRASAPTGRCTDVHSGNGTQGTSLETTHISTSRITDKQCGEAIGWNTIWQGKNEILPYVTRWKKVTDVVLSKRSQI